MTSNTYVFMFQVAEGLYAHTELVNPESSHFSGTLQARAVCDLGGKAEVMESEPLTPTWAQGELTCPQCTVSQMSESPRNFRVDME